MTNDEKQANVNCPFYGRALYVQAQYGAQMPFILFPTNGNQCGLVSNRHAPCILEIEGNPVEWTDCPIVSEVRI